MSSTMNCQTKPRGQGKKSIICIKKFLSALVAGSFQVSAGLSCMCEVSRGTSSYIYSEESKNPSFFCLSKSSRESVELSLCFFQFQPPEGASGLADRGLSLGAFRGSGSADRMTARTNDDRRWKQMNGSAGLRGECVCGGCVCALYK